jgi:hypothetical protein
MYGPAVRCKKDYNEPAVSGLADFVRWEPMLLD